MIQLKNKAQLDILRAGGQRLAAILEILAGAVKPGVTTASLDQLAAKLISANGLPAGQAGDEASFLGYRPDGAPRSYPASLCVSVNDEVVHGIPSGRQLVTGDIVSLDCGLNHRGLYTDMAITVGVGKISAANERLIETTKAALAAGIAAARPGGFTGDIGQAIAAVIKAAGFGIVKELSGHGVGFAVHEEPFVPNYGRAGHGAKLLPGMVLALEPMVTTGSPAVFLAADGYTYVTKDHQPAAHFEHTIAITDTGAIVLTML